MAPSLVFLLVLLSCSATATLVACSSSNEAEAGLRMKLAHVDDKGGYTTEERVLRAVAVSRQQQQQRLMAGAEDDVSAQVHRATRQYIASYLIGSPPQRAEALIDTGSDLIWTQCATTCLPKSCAKQGLPYYNLSQSSTFVPVPCADKAGFCAANGVHLCSLDGSCTFIASYGAGRVIGSLGTESFAFESGTTSLAFGCVSLTRITSGALNDASGLIGLGRGRLSLVSQIGATRFSYCLTPYFHSSGASSHLFVGASASLGGGGASMPFVKSPKDYPYSTFYYLPLEGITVGKTRLPAVNSTTFQLRQLFKGYWAGGVIIDTGSPLTQLASHAYEALKEEVAAQLGNGSLVPAPEDSGLELCVAREGFQKVVPALVFHFGGGADMAVPAASYWAPVDKAAACMMILEGGYDSIIGNFQQQDMHLLYDLRRGRFSFQTADCTML